MTTDNLNIILTNSLCCISAQAVKVSKLYSIGDKCADSELQKLKLMNDWFEALRCYNTETSINSKFIIKLPYDLYNSALKNLSNTGRNYIITVNGVSYTLVGDGVTTVIDLLTTMLLTFEEIISINEIVDPNNFSPRYACIIVEASCNTETINYTSTKIGSGDIYISLDFTQYQKGYCTVLNCLTETDFNIIVSKLMKECDICECQLNQ